MFIKKIIMLFESIKQSFLCLFLCVKKNEIHLSTETYPIFYSLLGYYVYFFFLKVQKSEVYFSNCIYDNAFSFYRHPAMHSFFFCLKCSVVNVVSSFIRVLSRNKHDWSSLSLLSSSSSLWTCCCCYSRQFSLLFFLYRQ